jgi:hypothetical protein
MPSLLSFYGHPAAALLLASSAWLAACGGGGDSSSNSPTESATAFVEGPISGFGSIIVNGVRYDDSTAAVLDDDDVSHGRDALKLGMMVAIDATQVDRAAGSGQALRIRFGSEIVGPVERVDLAADTLVLLGQTVRITATTVFDDSLSGGLAGLAVGRVLEVHALFDAASGQYVATRVEDDDDARTYQLRGTVANLDTAARSFTLGGARISYAGLAAADVPASLANGQRVRARLQTTPVAGQWVAVALRSGQRKLGDRDEAELQGTITAFTSTAAFEVNGVPVNAASARFPDGSAGVVLGARVEVEGHMLDGVLVAQEVDIESRHAAERNDFELHGAISAMDSGSQTFVLRGVRVSYAGSPVYEDGSAAQLANGRRIEVKGQLSADRSVLQARKIDFES